MKAILFFVLIPLLTGLAFGQDKNALLAGLTETITINQRTALRIATRDSRWIEIQKTTFEGEDALLFPVMRIKKFGLGLKPDDDGKFYVTPTKIVYLPTEVGRERNVFDRKQIVALDIEKNTKFEYVSFNVGEEKYRYILAGTVFMNGQIYGRKKVLIPALSFFYRAVNNYQAAVEEFTELTRNT